VLPNVQRNHEARNQCVYNNETDVKHPELNRLRVVVNVYIALFVSEFTKSVHGLRVRQELQKLMVFVEPFILCGICSEFS
jgi:hypothetical protein